MTQLACSLVLDPMTELPKLWVASGYVIIGTGPGPDPYMNKHGSITINVSVLYMARNILILMRATSITMAIGRGGPEIEPFWTLKWQQS